MENMQIGNVCGTDPIMNNSEAAQPNDKPIINELASEATASGRAFSYRYNELDLRNKIADGRIYAVNISYYPNGRICCYSTPEDIVSFEYDTNGNITLVSDCHGNITRTFDKLNRVTSYTDTNNNTIGYEYDKTGNLVKLTYPDNTYVCYEYDENNNPIKVTDWAGRITEYTYGKNNRVNNIVYPNGTIVTVTHDLDEHIQLKDPVDFGDDLYREFDYANDNEHIYNAENVRICNLCAGEDTIYVYNTNCKSNQLLVRISNGVTVKYVYGLGLIGEEVYDTFKPYHFDSREERSILQI